LCLISGGGSALMTAPIEGVSLADIQALTRSLLACGATINEINTLRKHLDTVKGGGLARKCAPAQLACLILSDVVGNPLDVIASGPAVPDPSTYADCWQIITHYNLQTNLPPAIQAVLQAGRNGKLPETLKPGDPIFTHTHNLLVGSNLQAAQAAIESARQAGYHTMLLTTYLQGEARQAGQMLAAIAHQVNATGQPVPRPACIIIGGETTVTLRGDGLGGRNQELALAAVAELSSLPNCLLVTCASDGEDGPTDAAGAFVTGDTLAYARQFGLHPAIFLQVNDSYHFFQALGDLFSPAPPAPT
jgi:hydroxypyruvate reductase